jgi:hypothetical protein
MFVADAIAALLRFQAIRHSNLSNMPVQQTQNQQAGVRKG